jgi:hypothetical protein
MLGTERFSEYAKRMSTLNVNIPESLQKRAQSLAQSEGVSLDQFIANAVAEKVAVLDADTYIHARAIRGTREKFERVLSKVPDVEPDPDDRLSAGPNAQP